MQIEISGRWNASRKELKEYLAEYHLVIRLTQKDAMYSASNVDWFDAKVSGDKKNIRRFMASVRTSGWRRLDY